MTGYKYIFVHNYMIFDVLNRDYKIYTNFIMRKIHPLYFICDDVMNFLNYFLVLRFITTRSLLNYTIELYYKLYYIM